MAIVTLDEDQMRALMRYGSIKALTDSGELITLTMREGEGDDHDD